MWRVPPLGTKVFGARSCDSPARASSRVASSRRSSAGETTARVPPAAPRLAPQCSQLALSSQPGRRATKSSSPRCPSSWPLLAVKMTDRLGGAATSAERLSSQQTRPPPPPPPDCPPQLRGAIPTNRGPPPLLFGGVPTPLKPRA